MIIIHAGYHKTGTTATQNFLDANRSALSRSGIRYSDSGMYATGNHLIPWALRGQEQRLPKAATIESVISAFARELESRAQQVLVVSSEEFEFLEPDAIVALKTLIGSEARIVFYLRRQDDFLLSSYKENVKHFGSRFSGDMFDFLMTHQLWKRLDFARLIGRWQSIFSPDCIHLRDYSHACEHPGGVVGDFIDNVLAPLAQGEPLAFGRLNAPVRRQPNISPPDAAIELIRHFNRFPMQRDGHRTVVRRATELATRARLDYRILTARNRISILSAFRDTNRILREQPNTCGRFDFGPESLVEEIDSDLHPPQWLGAAIGQIERQLGKG